MENNYATITHVELKRDILIPLEWPIRGIERTVLYIAQKMIMEPDAEKCFLEVQNIPAKLLRRPTRTGFINIFQKVSHEEIEDAFRCDVASPKDDRSVKIDIASGSQSISKLSVADAKRMSPKTQTSYVGVIPPGYK
ncbi:GSCOCT00013081001.2-RA-CDS [Cotesia congregata]|uniref:Cc_bv8.15_CcPL2.092 n=1 Tax=Cotesia congregata TaxID=51543 RepID=S6D4S3_COTCN|nr:GSCOCT00013081001.2-RA-CDS [Cotesia congregata]CAG5092456.1 cc_bv8.15_CcPL2.092 [Cotesia congregata]CCQ71201.1 hypothetical protein BV8-15 [Cotesia congregata]